MNASARDGARSAERTERLRKRVHFWAGRLNVQPTQIRIQRMTRKWASCSTAGWISLATDLAHQPRRFQDFAIVHELLHLRVPNHGRLFKALMNVHVPRWRILERRPGTEIKRGPTGG